MKNKIIVIFSSHLSDEVNNAFIKHVSDMIGVDHETHCYTNFDQYSLPEVYNKAIDEHHDDNAIMLFVHNDIYFETKDWGKILLKHFNNKHNDYQILGVAGSKSIPSSGCWWLTEDGKSMNRKDMIGIVNHDNSIRKWESRYSEPFFGVKPVVCIDGLFMAIDTKEIVNDFDNRFGKYHYYDLPICVSNYLDGCNIGVITDIRITHKSIGETNNEWEHNRKLFTHYFGADLPLRVEE